MYRRYFEIIKELAEKDTFENIAISKRNLDSLTDLKQQYLDILVKAGDLKAAEVLDTFNFDDILSLCHAGFSEMGLDKSVKEVVSEIDGKRGKP